MSSPVDPRLCVHIVIVTGVGLPEDDVLMVLAEFQSRLSEHSAPKEVYIALGILSNVEITNVLHELTRPF